MSALTSKGLEDLASFLRGITQATLNSNVEASHAPILVDVEGVMLSIRWDRERQEYVADPSQ